MEAASQTRKAAAIEIQNKLNDCFSSFARLLARPRFVLMGFSKHEKFSVKKIKNNFYLIFFCVVDETKCFKTTTIKSIESHRAVVDIVFEFYHVICLLSLLLCFFVCFLRRKNMKTKEEQQTNERGGNNFE